MSLDGFIAGPHASVEQPLGEGGRRLREWMFGLASWRKLHGFVGGEANRDSALVDEAFQSIGAVIMGERMYSRGNQIWGDIPPFHAPVFVLRHNAREPIRKAGATTYTFVPDGIHNALEQARAAAGGKNVSVGGGASVVQQFLAAGLLDEIQVHVVPVLLGAGIRLFEHLGDGHVDLEVLRVVSSPTVTHLRYRVLR